MECQVCRQLKDLKEFYRVKYFDKYHKAAKRWCRECQTDYISLKQQKQKEERFQKKVGLFTLTFE